MAQFENLMVVLFLSAVASSIVLVDANFSKSMYITWGYQHASLQGEDLQLVLDQTSGENFMLLGKYKTFAFMIYENSIKLHLLQLNILRNAR